MGSCLSTQSSSKSLPTSPHLENISYNTSTSPGSRKEDHTLQQVHRIRERLFLNGSTQCASLFTQQGNKGTNQDAMIVWESFGLKSDAVFCGIFDGHGPSGHLVAKSVRDSLPMKISAQWEVNARKHDVVRGIGLNTSGSMKCESASVLIADEVSRESVDIDETDKQSDFVQTLKDSFVKAYKAMDRELKMYTNIDCFCSGTTAVTLVKQGQNLVIGNVGDSRAIMGTRAKDNSITAIQLTVDLKPNLPEEAKRIQGCKGRVFARQDEPEVLRVWLPKNDCPGLAMSRALGDFCLKTFGLISVPEIFYRRLTEKDEFVVLATDGVWDVLSNDEVVDIVASVPHHSQAARSLVEAAVHAWGFPLVPSKVNYLDRRGRTGYIRVSGSQSSLSPVYAELRVEANALERLEHLQEHGSLWGNPMQILYKFHVKILHIREHCENPSKFMVDVGPSPLIPFLMCWNVRLWWWKRKI
ncbi:PPM-type phosphatase domain-containing protein [Heracleum sosnowskyi]|uniref:PPM-type phosphatase domain-containing protein n=1 Tax=Heracleum sosnowskyi TaxID=360622 RepID=A0AAD8IU19_9APIA|nr:PPM-type phosphatase domain-containing protein [Heracleum sosnowskyi]